MPDALASQLQVFETCCEDYYARARAEAAAGRKVAGYMCSYAPQELLHAAGYFPVRVLGRLGATPRADALMQAFICSFARSTFDAGLAGEFDYLDLMLFAHTCDTMQNLADLWGRNCPNMKTVVSAMPNVHGNAAARTYFRKELDRVRGCIEEAAGPIAEDTLRASIALYAKHRAAVKELYGLRRANPGALSGAQMMAVVLSSFLAPREEHLAWVEALNAAVNALPETAATNAPKVIVAGSVCQSRDFVAAIEAAGCQVVDDDLCMGTRSYLLPEPGEGDPMDVLTDQYLGRVPCPAIYKPDYDPAARAKDIVARSKADGVVFLITKFCDPFGFDYPHVNKHLEAAGIPTLMLEVEQHIPVPEQVRTRMEAFVEVLQSRKS